MSYFKLFCKTVNDLAEFSDAEIGRLIRAASKYAETGESQTLTGNERFVWPVLKNSIDSSTAAYNRQCAINKENGKKGGRPPKTELVIEEPNETDSVFEEPNESQVKVKVKVKDKVDVVVSEAGNESGGEWFSILKKHGFQTFESDVQKAEELAAQYSPEWLKTAIERASDQSETRNWKYVRAILKGFSDNGGIDSSTKPLPRSPYKWIHEDDYREENSRDTSVSNGLNPWL